MKIVELNGKKVITSDGAVLGEVEGADLEASRWQITHLYISLSDAGLNELGFKKPFMGKVVVCLPVLMVKSLGEVFSLNQSIHEIKNLKECH